MTARWGCAVLALLCAVLTPMAGAGSQTAADATPAAIAARLQALETARERDSAELQQLRAELPLQHGLSQLRRELRQLSEHVRTRGELRDELVELRSEIESMSTEMRQLRDRTVNTPARARGTSAPGWDPTLAAWLKDSVTQLKNQLADLEESFNSTQLLHLQQVTESRLELAQHGLQQLEIQQRAQQAELAAQRAQQRQLESDLTQQLAQQQLQKTTWAALLDQVEALRQEFLFPNDIQTTPELSREMKQRHHRPGLKKKHNHRRHSRHEVTGSRHRGPRGHRHFHQRVLADIVDVLYKKQLQMDDQLTAVSANVTSLQNRQLATVKTGEVLTSQMEAVTSQFDEGRRQRELLSWRLNVSESGAAGQLRRSGAALARELGALQSRLDSQVALLRTDLTQVDVRCSRLSGSVAELSAEQDKAPHVTNQLRQEMAALVQQQQADRTQLMVVQADLLDLALDRSSPHTGAEEPRPGEVADTITDSAVVPLGEVSQEASGSPSITLSHTRNALDRPAGGEP